VTACPVLIANRMPPEELRSRTQRFAITIIRFCRTLPRSDEARQIGRQLLRSGTAVGANYRAVCRPRSDADFIAKLGTVIEESDESAFWLEVLAAAEIVPGRAVDRLLDEVDQLIRIFVASRETARRNALARRKRNRAH
jgi:four helix bundle protein